MGLDDSISANESEAPAEQYVPTSETKTQPSKWRETWEDVKHTLTTRDGLMGDYDYLYLFTPNVWPLNRKYKDHVPPFFGPNEKIPLLLIVILGLQHALTMISGIVAPILTISRSAFYFDGRTTEYLISAAFITSGIATLLQITRTRIRGTPYYLGAGLLSVIGPTFDIIPMAIRYTAPLYAKGVCPTSASGAKLPCPDAYGNLIGTILVCVWIQFLVAFIPAKALKKVFPPVVTGNLLLVLGIYLVSTAAESWGGGASCMDGKGTLALCPSTAGPNPLPWGDSKLIGLGFSVFATIIAVEILGSPLMKSASIIFGLAVGSAISGATGYWSSSQIHQAPAVTFLWTTTFNLGVDGGLVLPLMILFLCEALVCMPSVASTSEISGVETEGTKANTRIQGGILCDAVGSFVAGCGGVIPMVSHAGNNGVIVVTSNASRRAGYCAAVIIILMGVFGKFGAVFASMPSSILGGMQTFLYATIAISGMRILATIPWTRRNRFILAASLGIGLLDVVTPTWFDRVLDYNGKNVHLMGFLEGINLLVETPFILTMVVAVILNAIMPRERGHRHQEILLKTGMREEDGVGERATVEGKGKGS